MHGRARSDPFDAPEGWFDAMSVTDRDERKGARDERFARIRKPVRGCVTRAEGSQLAVEARSTYDPA